MKTSQSAIDKLKAIEQFSATAYPDPPGSGNYSIGYGHQIQPSEMATLLKATITRATADKLFAANLVPLENRLNAAKYPFKQNEFDGILSFGYNCGEGALQKVIDTWNATHDIKKVTAQIAEYTKVTKNGVKVASSALEQRRASEIMTILQPTFPTLAVVGLASLVALYALSR